MTPATKPLEKLTIGIPVLNCRDTIESCLLPLFEIVNPEVFTIIILVSDSDDGSIDVIKEICRSNDKTNIEIIFDGPAKGIEHAIWKLVELSKTEWIWLLSGDDIPVKNWFQLVSSFLEKNHDLAVFQTIQANSLGEPLFYRNNMKPTNSVAERSYIFPEQKKAFLSKIKSTDAIFSCISNVIFKKSMWQHISEDKYAHYKKTNFMHSMRLLANLNTATRMKVYGEPLVVKRGGEDSFSKLGLIRRALMTYESYGQQLEGFSRTELAFIKSAADYEWPWYRCIKVISGTKESQLKHKFLRSRFRSWSIIFV